MKKLVYLLLFSLLFSCPSDNDYDKEDYLTIKNNSTYNVYRYSGGYEPILNVVPPVENSLILANSEVIISEVYKRLLSDGETWYIWLFDQEVVNNNSWEDIVENDMYLIRYDLTLQNLIDMNWEIDYTGE